MLTEAFTISDLDEKNIGYIDIDRTYQYGGLMIVDDDAFPDDAGVKGCTYFKEFDKIIELWLKNLNINKQTVKIKINTDVNRLINLFIIKDRKDTIFYMDIEDFKIKNLYTEETYIKNTKVSKIDVGFFGFIFNYFTGIIEDSIPISKSEMEYTDIWGIQYV